MYFYKDGVLVLDDLCEDGRLGQAESERTYGVGCRWVGLSEEVALGLGISG